MCCATPWPRVGWRTRVRSAEGFGGGSAGKSAGLELACRVRHDADVDIFAPPGRGHCARCDSARCAKKVANHDASSPAEAREWACSADCVFTRHAQLRRPVGRRRRCPARGCVLLHAQRCACEVAASSGEMSRLPEFPRGLFAEEVGAARIEFKLARLVLQALHDAGSRTRPDGSP